MKELKVLYVDDDGVSRTLLKKILEKHPAVYEAIGAKDGEEALEVLGRDPDVDMVFLDIIMPKVDGIQMVEFMKRDPRFKSIPIIVFSTDDTQKIKAIEAGANDFINKPITEEKIFEKIEKYGGL
ncbi:MAG: response regulator [Epsilonproteobacteria bacterium]|nr:response regulator [Campylobacterota bacterium]NPA56485.1 response regulator [Campylobacterota bacterium]